MSESVPLQTVLFQLLDFISAVCWSCDSHVMSESATADSIVSAWLGLISAVCWSCDSHVMSVRVQTVLFQPG